MVLVLLTSGLALAQEGLQGGGDAQVTDSWIVNETCGGCGPTTAIEFFIVNDTGAGPFEDPGLSNLPAGWVGSLINPNYSLATGPSTNVGSWTEHYLGEITDSVRIDLIMWTGEPETSSIAFAASYTRSVNGSLTVHCQAFGQGCPDMQYPDGIGYDRSSSSPHIIPVPVLSPIGFILLLLALGGAGAWTMRRRKFV